MAALVKTFERKMLSQMLGVRLVGRQAFTFIDPAVVHVPFVLHFVQIDDAVPTLLLAT